MLHVLAYAYNYNAPTSDGSPNAGITGGIILVGLVILALVVVLLAGIWKMFVKAGRPGWAAIIPIYNSWVIYEIAGKPGWWALVGLLAVIPVFGYIAGVVALVLTVVAMLELARRFGKGSWFAVFGLVLFSTIGFIILGFGKAKYETERTLGGGDGAELPEQPAAKPRKPKQAKKAH